MIFQRGAVQNGLTFWMNWHFNNLLISDVTSISSFQSSLIFLVFLAYVWGSFMGYLFLWPLHFTIHILHFSFVRNTSICLNKFSLEMRYKHLIVSTYLERDELSFIRLNFIVLKIPKFIEGNFSSSNNTLKNDILALT